MFVVPSAKYYFGTKKLLLLKIITTFVPTLL